MEQQYLQYCETTPFQHDYDFKRHFALEEKVVSSKLVPFIRVDSAITTVKTITRDPINIDLSHPDTHTYLPGEVISGTVTVDPYYSSAYSNHRNNRRRVDVHLACSFRVDDDEMDLVSSNKDKKRKKKKQSIFKVMMSPIYISNETNQSSFSLAIPADLPAYNPSDESVHGRIEYKIKAIYEISSDLPLSLYPKTSKAIFISATISTTDPKYLTPMQMKKEITITVPKDVALKAQKLRKGEKGRVSARLYIPTSCFLPGDSIPFSLEIQHIAPIKQLQGIQVILERITRIRYDGMDSIETKVMEKSSILPFVCDLENNRCVIATGEAEGGGLTIPGNDMSPSTPASIVPFDIQYRLKVLINMDMHHFLEDIPLRKRDRAYSMVTKIVGSLEQDGLAFFYGTTIEIDLPVTIGTTREHTSSTNKPCNISGRNRLSLPTVLSSPHLMVTSPENLSPPQLPQKVLNRFESDPTFNRHHDNGRIYSLIVQQQQQQQKDPSTYLSSTASLLGIQDNRNNTETIDRPPSAPPLLDLLMQQQQQQEEDQTNPPPYLE